MLFEVQLAIAAYFQCYEVTIEVLNFDCMSKRRGPERHWWNLLIDGTTYFVWEDICKKGPKRVDVSVAIQWRAPVNNDSISFSCWCMRNVLFRGLLYKCRREWVYQPLSMTKETFGEGSNAFFCLGAWSVCRTFFNFLKIFVSSLGSALLYNMPRLQLLHSCYDRLECSYDFMVVENGWIYFMRGSFVAVERSWRVIFCISKCFSSALHWREISGKMTVGWCLRRWRDIAEYSVELLWLNVRLNNWWWSSKFVVDGNYHKFDNRCFSWPATYGGNWTTTVGQ